MAALMSRSIIEAPPVQKSFYVRDNSPLHSPRRTEQRSFKDLVAAQSKFELVEYKVPESDSHYIEAIPELVGSQENSTVNLGIASAKKIEVPPK